MNKKTLSLISLLIIPGILLMPYSLYAGGLLCLIGSIALGSSLNKN